jgi:hypothetical protein
MKTPQIKIVTTLSLLTAIFLAVVLPNRTIGQATVHQPTLIDTNLIGGFFYTNNWDQIVEFSCTISNNLTTTAGSSKSQVWMFSQGAATTIGRTQNVEFIHSSLDTVARTNSVYVAMKVLPRYVVCITNLSTGGGNDSRIQIGSGQIFIP